MKTSFKKKHPRIAEFFTPKHHVEMLKRIGRMAVEESRASQPLTVKDRDILEARIDRLERKLKKVV